jgi:hypothetical protein
MQANGPDRYVVVDGNAYWISTPAPVEQPGRARPITWGQPTSLMHTPATPAGFAWETASPVDTFDNDQAAAIIAALTETYAGLGSTQEVA